MFGRAPDDSGRKKEPRALPSELASAFRGTDDALHQLGEVIHRDVAFGEMNEIDLLGKKSS